MGYGFQTQMRCWHGSQTQRNKGRVPRLKMSWDWFPDSIEWDMVPDSNKRGYG